MSLRELDLLKTCRSDDCDLVKDFYEPCLKRSLTYDRAVGFFSSSALALVARGLTAFIQAGGGCGWSRRPSCLQQTWPRSLKDWNSEIWCFGEFSHLWRVGE
ncbi:MAG: hypothetical protein ACTS3T_01760 [Almyronema sp.]|uniref:Uncharacterized protein n=1 Tax=Almyronema epifaneia S1 TaxID=2991925 RepID=A0ABW6ICN4_9CYAN